MFRAIFPINWYEAILSDDFSKLHDFKKEIRATDWLNGIVNNKEGSVGSSHNRILEHPDLYYIKKTLMYHFNDFIHSFCGVPYETDNCITTSWLVRIKKGGRVHHHNHTNSWYSGLLYFDDDYTGAVPLSLENPYAAFNNFNVDMDNTFSPDGYYEVIPQPNKIFFFPSYLKHMSAVQTGDKPRYTLAWNIYPKGKLGASDSDSYLDTKWLNS